MTLYASRAPDREVTTLIWQLATVVSFCLKHPARLETASWIELYALSEMAIYGVSAGWVVFFVRRSERRAGPRPVTMPSA